MFCNDPLKNTHTQPNTFSRMASSDLSPVLPGSYPATSVTFLWPQAPHTKWYPAMSTTSMVLGRNVFSPAPMCNALALCAHPTCLPTTRPHTTSTKNASTAPSDSVVFQLFLPSLDLRLASAANAAVCALAGTMAVQRCSMLTSVATYASGSGTRNAVSISPSTNFITWYDHSIPCYKSTNS
jgi:hypothetical protein